MFDLKSNFWRASVSGKVPVTLQTQEAAEELNRLRLRARNYFRMDEYIEPFPLDPPSSPREPGVYCHYETYPAGPTPDQGQNNQQLVIERVAGNGTVSRFECSRSEAAAILKFFLNTRCEVTV